MSRARPARAAAAPLWSGAACAALALAGLALPFAPGGPSGWAALGGAAALPAALALAAALAGRAWAVAGLLPLGAWGGAVVVAGLDRLGGAGAAGYWALLWGFLLAALAGVARLALAPAREEEPALERRLRALLPPLSVPVALLLLWQGLVVGYDVPKGIFPAVTDVARALAAGLPVLLQDAWVTFVKEVLFGFALGVAGGLLAGLAIAGSRFLQRGFLPLAAAFGAVPIVGLAPVLGRAFGVDWESKAAVVVIVTFFPVVLNTVQGLTEVDPLEVEMMRSWAARPRDVLLKLRLPNALPYLFNAMKLAAVLAVISVIVAEFLIPGPPVGLGQRISLSARRGAFDVVFAAILVSSVISIAFYGLLSGLERRVTAWHPSWREEP